MGNGVCGQSITAPLCYAFFLTLFPAPAWVLFMGCRSSWTAPVWALCLCCSSFGIRLLQHEVLYELQSGFLSSVGCKGSTSITMVFPKTEGESLLGHLEHLLPSCCSCLRALRTVSLIFFLTPHSQTAFCPFLNTLFLKHHHLGCQGLSQGLWWGHWISLEWAVASKGQPWLLITEIPAASPASTWAPTPGTEWPSQNQTLWSLSGALWCIGWLIHPAPSEGSLFPSLQCSPPLGGNLEP